MKRKSAVPIVIIAVLLVVAYIVLQRPGEQIRSSEERNVLVDYDSSAVDRIEVDSPTGHIVLEKVDDIWRITSPINYPAAPQMVGRAVGKGRDIELRSLVSTNPDKRNLFEVDSTGMLVRISSKGEEIAGIRVGKTSTSLSDTYVRLEGSDDVYIAGGVLSSTFDRKPNDWRDKTIFSAPQESITSISYMYGDTAVGVTLEDSVWKFEGEKIGEPTSLLAALSKFEAESFVDSVPENVPALSASLEVNGVTISFHFDKEGDKYYVRTSRSPQWFSVPKWKAKQVLKRRSDFLVMKKASG